MNTRKIWIKPRDSWIPIEYISDPNKEFTIETLTDMDETLEATNKAIAKGIAKQYGSIDKLKVGDKIPMSYNDRIIIKYQILEQKLRQMKLQKERLEEEEEELLDEYNVSVMPTDEWETEEMLIYRSDMPEKKKREFHQKREELTQRIDAHIATYKKNAKKLQSMYEGYQNAKVRLRRKVTPKKKATVSLQDLQQSSKKNLSSNPRLGGKKKKRKKTKKRRKKKTRKRKSRKKIGHYLLGRGI